MPARLSPAFLPREHALPWLGLVCAGLAVWEPALPLWAGAVAAIGCALGGLVVGYPGAAAPLLPALVVSAGGGIPAWGLATVAGALVWWDGLRRAQRDGRAAARVREQLAVAVYQQELLNKQAQRQPQVLRLCTTLLAAQETGQLAGILCQQLFDVLPEAQAVSALIIGQGAQRFAEERSRAKAPRLSPEQEHYVLEELRPLVSRVNDVVLAAVPLRGDRRSPQDTLSGRGLIAAVFPARGLEDQLVLDTLEGLGRLAGLSLASVRLLEQARALALFDDLTGLYGQHEFLRRLQEQVALARRQALHPAVIMCDMDHLKQFNDRFGHAAGDRALRLIAALIRERLPAEALACRYGGEEFAVLVPQGHDPAAIAENLCRGIAALALPEGVSVTASCGWAQWQLEESAEAWLARADQACYRAKALGRNRVERA